MFDPNDPFKMRGPDGKGEDPTRNGGSGIIFLFIGFFLIVLMFMGGCANSKDNEYLGRTVGSEVGRALGGGSGDLARLGSIAGGVFGGAAARPMDEAARENERMRDIERRAREKAVADAAYEAELERQRALRAQR